MTVLASTTSAPAPGLRERLAEAIRCRDLAAADEAYAKNALDQALAALADCQREADLIRDDLAARHRAAIAESAQALVAAFKAGQPASAGVVLLDNETPALRVAVARCEALQGACDQLRSEHHKATEVTWQHRHRVTDLSDAILLAEAEVVAAEAIAAQARADELLDRLAGLCLRDQKRLGGPQLRDLQARTVARLDRHRLEMANDPQLIEKHNWLAFLDQRAADYEAAYKAFAGRLAQDANASFEPLATVTTDQGAAA